MLLVGAPGTGKRTVAEIIHHFAGGETPSLARVCTDVPGPIAPPEGFAFVSPIEQLSLDQQAKLRRDVGLSRLILGTRLDPDSRDGQARLSPELLRWCSIRIDLPCLVERIDDLEALVIGLLHRVPTTRPVGAISDDALGCLRAHDWPGNVSELENVITTALEVGTTTQIELQDLPAALRERDPSSPGPSAPEQEFALALAERRAVQRVMRLVRGNKRKAARLLQIGKTTLYRRLHEYDSSSG
ncbi:Sigma-54 dependent DNA-binding response regulator Nla28 [Enhygromyxa salina]|uniref:Sigma-54 dependent DNA-binding response regulator Nla28 n=1 Tax=Enhygromyxa salina TaxID=215803 RepID=A0A0C2D0U7_9BACT|nr:Sigma-54 dependent DNA-binding response regulator Nla28 [Enhygromyxa salina]